MKIADIFSDSFLVQKSAMSSIGRRFTSDCNAIGGATLEEQIMVNFNKSSKTHKVLNLSTIELVMDQNQWSFDFGRFAKDIKDLRKKSKLDEGYLSAADFFLFKVSGKTLVMTDAASLKTSIPTDPHKKSQSPCFVHNDASGIIHDWIVSGAKNKNIGNIIMMVLRGDECRVYHYNGNLDNLMKNHYVVRESKHKDLYIGYSNETSKVENALFITNRNAITGNKPTSFRRGMKITCSQSSKQDYFDAFQHYVEQDTMSELCSFVVSMPTVKRRMLKTFGL
jgi:hypothetical protein